MFATHPDFDISLRSLFALNDVSYYLDKAAVISRTSKISPYGKGPAIAFDYFDESCMNKIMQRSSKRIAEPLKFGMEDVDKFVGDYK